jgi:UDP-2-acetamido-3-amino-2,3-dideoxy-glucuronate N-acetyltransferase
LVDYTAHNTAIIDFGAQIGSGTKIWHWVHICAGARIGNFVSLGQNVFVGNEVVIGNNCKIQNNVSIYDKVILHDDVFCGPSVVFTNVKNPRAAIVRKDSYDETIVSKGATLGANSTIVCGNSVGEYAFVAAGAVVTSDVKPFALVVGVPARQIGWWSKLGERIPLALKGSGVYKCSQTGDIYELLGNSLVEK